MEGDFCGQLKGLLLKTLFAPLQSILSRVLKFNESKECRGCRRQVTFIFWSLSKTLVNTSRLSLETERPTNERSRMEYVTFWKQQVPPLRMILPF